MAPEEVFYFYRGMWNLCVVLKIYSQCFKTIIFVKYSFYNTISLSYDVASGSEITPCNKIDKPLFRETL